MMAAAISIVHAASPHPHRLNATPATVAGAMAAAATAARRQPSSVVTHLQSLNAQQQIKLTGFPSEIFLMLMEILQRLWSTKPFGI